MWRLTLLALRLFMVYVYYIPHLLASYSSSCSLNGTKLLKSIKRGRLPSVILSRLQSSLFPSFRVSPIFGASAMIATSATAFYASQYNPREKLSPSRFVHSWLNDRGCLALPPYDLRRLPIPACHSSSLRFPVRLRVAADFRTHV